MRFFGSRQNTGLEKIYNDGETIIREGEKGSEMYIIKSGAVKVIRNAAQTAHILATLGPGDFFGEMALFDNAPRSATVTAVGETRVISIHAGSFLLRIRNDPTFVFEMMAKMSLRVRELNRNVQKLLDEADIDPSEYDKIFVKAEYI